MGLTINFFQISYNKIRITFEKIPYPVCGSPL